MSNKVNNKLHTEILDIDKFVKVNDLKPITNPVFFNGPVPTSDGLLSNEIFGITKSERAGIYAYIDLGGYFIQPLMYKTLCRLNSKISEIVNGTDTFSITSDGDIVKDPNGDTGIVWLKKNFDKIKFKETDSISRTKKIKFIKKEKSKMWINKYIVIPPYYRDVDSKDGASVGVGEINKLYSSLIIASRSLKDTAGYGLSLADANRGRIQTTLQQIYDWFGAGTTINGKETPAVLPGKTGIIKKGVMYKTVDYSTRLVMSAPQLKAENIEDLMVDMDHAGLPLASAIVNFQPYIIFYLRRFFENQFAGEMTYPIHIKNKNGEIKELMAPLDDYQITFSDVEIKKQIDRFVHGYSNRFIPVPIPFNKAELVKISKENKIELNNENMYMKFTGRYKSIEDTSNELANELINRPLTWCDLFFIAANEVTRDKMILITRFPFDSYLNQYPSSFNIKSTVKTEPVIINGVTYKWYPRIRAEDISTNTSPLFVDTLSICNGLIDAMGLDYDGDTAIIKPIYFIESNIELRKAADSKVNIIGMDGISARGVSKENVMCLYSLTVQPDESIKLIDPVF